MRQLFFATRPVTRVLWACIVTVLLGLAPAVGRASVILGNLGAGDGSNQSIDANNWLAASFTMGSLPYILSDVQVRLSNPVASTTFVLESNAGGAPSGTILSTFTGSLPSGTNTITLNAGPSITLAAGTTYWLVGHTTTASTAWIKSNPQTSPSGSGATFGQYSSSNNAGSTWTLFTSSSPKFQLDGIAIPEPSSLALVGTVACVGGAVGWRRRRTGNSS
jgi:hypothetical protein